MILAGGREFAEEYRRGNGTISPEFEAKLAARASVEVQALATHPVYSLPRACALVSVALITLILG